MTLGEKLRSLRAISGWTQPECADKIGIEQSYLSKLENDKSIPSAEIFDAICAVYKTSPDEIIKDINKDYVRKSLMHIPIVSASTNGNFEDIKNKRKRNIIICASFILASVILFSVSYFQIIANDHVYEYFSHGTHHSTEINRCLKSNDKEECYLKFTGKFNPNHFPASTLKIAPNTLLIKEYRGGKFHIPAGEAFREYRHQSDYEQKGLINKLLLLLSIFMLTLGLLGLFIEARFYRIDRQ